MSRSEYTDDCETIGLYRAAVKRSLAGRRGQAFLEELEAALIGMPTKRLEKDVFVSYEGCCAMGAVALARGLGSLLSTEHAARLLGISSAMAAEIAFENDDYDNWYGPSKTPEERWQYMLDWTREQLRAGPLEPKSRGRCRFCCRVFRVWPRAGVVSHHKWLGEVCPGARRAPLGADDMGPKPKRRQRAKWVVVRARASGVVEELWRGDTHLATIESYRSDWRWRVEIGDRPTGEMRREPRWRVAITARCAAEAQEREGRA